MDIQKFRALLKAVDLGSFSAAAEEMGFTPSGISHMVDAVESELGVTLLQRSRSGVMLTNAGEALLPTLRDLVRVAGLLSQRAADLRGVDKGTVTIGSYPSMASQWLPTIMRDFHRDFPGIKMQLMEGTHQELDEWMKDYRVDFCLYSYLGGGDYEWLPLYNDPMMVVLPPDHPLAGRKFIRPEECSGQPFIMPAGGRDCDVMKILEECAIKPDIQFSTIENNAVLSMIECGLGISIMNQLCVRGRDINVVALPIKPPRYSVMGIAVPSLKNASPAARKMIQYIRRDLARRTSEQ